MQIGVNVRANGYLCVYYAVFLQVVKVDLLFITHIKYDVCKINAKIYV